MGKISIAQKKIIVITAVILSTFLIFWLFVYLPRENTVKRIKSKLLGIKNQIKEIEAIIGKTQSDEKSLQLLIQRSQKLNQKFPQKEEEGIRMLAYFMRNLNIELVSIKPQLRKAFLDEDKKTVEIEGKTCQIVFISIEMKCTYKDLVKYIETMQEALPALITIERLRINKPSSAAATLTVALDINLYLLS